MGVDYYSCDRCSDTYCDGVHYVTCNEEAGGCERSWCGNECADKDGYRECSCKLGKDIDENGYADENCDCQSEGGDYCDDCENFIRASCNYCRNEDFEDEDIIDYILKEYANNRSINEIKEEMRLEYNK